MRKGYDNLSPLWGVDEIAFLTYREKSKIRVEMTDGIHLVGRLIGYSPQSLVLERDDGEYILCYKRRVLRIRSETDDDSQTQTAPNAALVG